MEATNKTIQELQDHLMPIIYPESLESSRVISILSESLSFKVSDLFQLKEVQKVVQKKEDLVECLKSSDFIKMSDDNVTGTIDIQEDIVVFTILNFPPKMTKQEIISALELSNVKYLRLYKKSLFWNIASLDQSAVSYIQSRLSLLKFDDTKLKFDMITKSQMMKGIQKQIQTCNYHKEANELRAETVKKSCIKDDGASTNSDAFSWRKRSGEGVSSFDSAEKGSVKKKTKDSHPSSFNRERFNSDGNANIKSTTGYRVSQYSMKNPELEEIEIDISNLKYSLSIKYKYSFQEMQAFAEKLTLLKQFDQAPKFNGINIEEILADKPKSLVFFSSALEKPENKSNSRKASYGSKYDAQPTSGGNLAEFKGSHGANNLKLPKMNPLCSIPKTFNKYDVIPGNINILASQQAYPPNESEK